MAGEQNLQNLLEEMTPRLNSGQYVFVTTSEAELLPRKETICEFKEKEGITLVVNQKKADELGLTYEFVASWITLEVHSSLEAVGLTAIFSNALAKANISCNVIAGYFHDHIFVAAQDASAAIQVLEGISTNYKSFI